MNERKPRLIGLGLDEDGHVRITKAPDYRLEGGTQETHEWMQAATAKIDERLKEQGYSIGSASSDRLSKTINEVVQEMEE